MDALNASTFSGVLMVLGLPGDFLFSVDPVAQRLEIHSKIVFRSGTDAFRPSAKRHYHRTVVLIIRFNNKAPMSDIIFKIH